MFVLEEDDKRKYVNFLADWWEHHWITYESLASFRSLIFRIWDMTKEYSYLNSFPGL